MNGDILPLRFVAWFFTIVPLVAIVAGALLLRLLQKQGRLSERYLKNYSVWNDIALLFIWGMGFLGGLGTLNRKPWGVTTLEYFCWVMIVLTVVTSLTRLKMLREEHARARHTQPMKWGAAIAAAMIAVSPIVMFLGAAISTLHGDAALAIK
jgi:4-hydroxybenzoate polyprenyltransferase